MLMVENWGNEFAWCNFLLLQLINHKTYVKSRLKCDWNRWRQQATLGRTDNQCSFFQITSHLRNENITDVDDHLHDISKDWLYPEVSTVYRLHTIRYDKRKNSSMQQFRMALSYDPLCWETYGGICSLGVFEESFHSFRQCSFPASQKTLVSQRINFSEGETMDQL
ncbi:uncharacterized protein LOC106407497 [Brassica napus]|uniref:uncharacterized protein LOC106407497 n=1 Tax=Brassica napus TaxID=3708 RepID=UPI00207A3BB4|nr:uncharacterized protein LOC106407497 [Brassica napus]